MGLTYSTACKQAVAPIISGATEHWELAESRTIVRGGSPDTPRKVALWYYLGGAGQGRFSMVNLIAELHPMGAALAMAVAAGLVFAFVAEAADSAPSGSAPAARLPRLRVSDNHRFIVKEDGTPFFYFADTAWELFHRLNREDAAKYLDNRASLKYTAIQAVLVAERDGVRTPNACGRKPFIDNDPAKPDITPGTDPKDPGQYDYWDHVDYIVDYANSKGIYIAMLPSWGSWVDSRIINAGNAQAYGEFLGKRYARKGIIWVLGGDRNYDGTKDVWRAMAKGIAIGATGSEDYSKVLMTCHPGGGMSSSRWFHDDPWLSFNMWQTGHGGNTPVWESMQRDYNRQPTKPVMDGESLYEDHPIGFNAKANGYSVDLNVRRNFYLDLFAGAHGITYGNHCIWQMHKGDSGINGPQFRWDEAINHPGGAQGQHARALIESRPFLIRIPDQSVLTGDVGTSADRVQATRAADGCYAMVYSAQGKAFTVNMDKFQSGPAKAWWYDPRTGEAKPAGEFKNAGTQEFTPPSSGRGNDWVLVLDDASRGFPAPGSAPYRGKQ